MEQLKTTLNSDHINNWIEKYPGSEGSLKAIPKWLINLDLESSGVSDKELSVNVDKFLDKLIEMDQSIYLKLLRHHLHLQLLLHRL